MEGSGLIIRVGAGGFGEVEAALAGSGATGTGGGICWICACGGFDSCLEVTGFGHKAPTGVKGFAAGIS
jgi:hypothetical protein